MPLNKQDKNDKTPNIDHDLQNITQVLFQHVTDELRSRRQPEYIYTAAAVGSFGAIAWGVAALAALQIRVPMCRHPALAGIIAIFGIAIPVVIKIRREHSHYVALRKEQQELAATMAAAYKFAITELPKGLQKTTDRTKETAVAGRGHLLSILIVTGAGVGSILFCISIGLL